MGDVLSMVENVNADAAEQSRIDRLIEEHLPLVGYAVAEVSARLPYHVSRDDLTSAAMLALVRAARSFEPARGVPFGHYAKSRLRGAIVDELRDNDRTSRGVRYKARQLAQAEEVLSAQLGRYPTTDELAMHLGTSVAEVRAVEGDVHRSVVLSIQGFADAGTLDAMLPSAGTDPERELLDRERTGYLLAAVEALPERLAAVVRGYFFEEQPMAQLAEELGVSESRISQMRAEALSLLKDAMLANLMAEQPPLPGQPAGCAARRRASYIAAVAALAAGSGTSFGSATQRLVRAGGAA